MGRGQNPSGEKSSKIQPLPQLNVSSNGENMQRTKSSSETKSS